MTSMALVLLMTLGNPAPMPADPKLAPDDFLTELEAQEHAILRKLRTESIWNWKDPAAKKQLVQTLRIAKQLRSPAFAPILAQYIAYMEFSPIGFTPPRQGRGRGGWMRSQATTPEYKFGGHRPE